MQSRTTQGLPDKFAVPTMKELQSFSATHKTMGATTYMLHLNPTEKLKNEKIYSEDTRSPLASGDVELLSFRDRDDYNLPLFYYIYSIFLDDFNRNPMQPAFLGGRELDISDLALIRFGRTRTDLVQKQEIEHELVKLSELYGVIEQEKPWGQGVEYIAYPVLQIKDINITTGHIEFQSPYFMAIIKRKEQIAKTKDNYKPIAKDAYAALPGFGQIRNQAVARNVILALEVIKQTGDGRQCDDKAQPHLSAKTLYDRNPELQQQLKKSSNPSLTLKRVFKQTLKAWEKCLAPLEETYPGLTLPPSDPDRGGEIPHLGDLSSTVYYFTHDKRKRRKPGTLVS